MSQKGAYPNGSEYEKINFQTSRSMHEVKHQGHFHGNYLMNSASHQFLHLILPSPLRMATRVLQKHPNAYPTPISLDLYLFTQPNWFKNSHAHDWWYRMGEAKCALRDLSDLDIWISKQSRRYSRAPKSRDLVLACAGKAPAVNIHSFSLLSCGDTLTVLMICVSWQYKQKVCSNHFHSSQAKPI